MKQNGSITDQRFRSVAHIQAALAWILGWLRPLFERLLSRPAKIVRHPTYITVHWTRDYNPLPCPLWPTTDIAFADERVFLLLSDKPGSWLVRLGKFGLRHTNRMGAAFNYFLYCDSHDY